MTLKGIEMPVNSVIVIALAVMVLLMLATFFFGGTGQTRSVSIESAWGEGCNILKVRYNCDGSKVSEIRTADITGDGIEDSLLAICKIKYGEKATKYGCRNICCGTIITEGTPCEEPEDCRFGFGKTQWDCDTSTGCYSPPIIVGP